MTSPAMVCTTCGAALTSDVQRYMGRCNRHRRVCSVPDCHNPVPAENTDRVCSTKCRHRRKAARKKAAPPDPAQKRPKRRSRPTNEQAGTRTTTGERQRKQRTQGSNRARRPNPPKPTQATIPALERPIPNRPAPQSGRKGPDTQVFTPPPITEFMLRSVDAILRSEFGAALDGGSVELLEPFCGDGRMVVQAIMHTRDDGSPLIAADRLIPMLQTGQIRAQELDPETARQAQAHVGLAVLARLRARYGDPCFGPDWPVTGEAGQHELADIIQAAVTCGDTFLTPIGDT